MRFRAALRCEYVTGGSRASRGPAAALGATVCERESDDRRQCGTGTVKLAASGCSVCLMSSTVRGSRKDAAACDSCNAHSGAAFDGNAVSSRSNAAPIDVSSSEKPREMAARRSRFSS